MADARTEQIMDAAITALTGLTTTGSNVVRQRVYRWEHSALPGLNVRQGDLSPVEDDEEEAVLTTIEWRMDLLVEAVVAAASDVDQTLNLIHKEVFAAMAADRKLGLSFVVHSYPGPVLEPEVDDSGKVAVAKMVISYIVRFRTSRTALDA